MIEESEASNPPAGQDAGQGKPANPEPEDNSKARLALVVRGNAARMARRLVAGNVPSPEVLADALAISVDSATEWLGKTMAGTEEQITTALATIRGST